MSIHDSSVAGLLSCLLLTPHVVQAQIVESTFTDQFALVFRQEGRGLDPENLAQIRLIRKKLERNCRPDESRPIMVWVIAPLDTRAARDKQASTRERLQAVASSFRAESGGLVRVDPVTMTVDEIHQRRSTHSDFHDFPLSRSVFVDVRCPPR